MSLHRKTSCCSTDTDEKANWIRFKQQFTSYTFHQPWIQWNELQFPAQYRIDGTRVYTGVNTDICWLLLPLLFPPGVLTDVVHRTREVKQMKEIVKEDGKKREWKNKYSYLIIRKKDERHVKEKNKYIRQCCIYEENNLHFLQSCIKSEIVFHIPGSESCTELVCYLMHTGTAQHIRKLLTNHYHSVEYQNHK